MWIIPFVNFTAVIPFQPYFIVSSYAEAAFIHTANTANTASTANTANTASRPPHESKMK